MEKESKKLSFVLGIGNGKLEEITSYNQLVDHLEAADNDANEISDDLFKFRAFIGHQGPHKPTDPNWKGCKYNVLVDWETGEKTYEPLSVLAADDPVTWAMYAKENDLLHIDGWKRFRNLAKRYKTLTRTVMQSRIMQVRRAKKYMFGYLIPRSYKEALEFDKENNNTNWADATREEMDSIKEQQVFTKHQRVKWDSSHKRIINSPPNHQKIRVILIFAVKHDGRHKARLVADGSPTPEPVHLLRSYIHLLPQWEQLLLERVHLHTDAFTVASHLSQPNNKWIAVSNGSVQRSQASFGWVIAQTSRQCIAQCNGPAHGHKRTSHRLEGYGILSLLQGFLNLSTYTYQTTLKHLMMYTDSESWVKTINAVTWDMFFLNGTITSDWDILQIIISSLVQFQHKPTLSHVKGHQDSEVSYAQLSLPAKLNVDADHLTSRYQALPNLQFNIIPAITGCNAYVSIMGKPSRQTFCQNCDRRRH